MFPDPPQPRVEFREVVRAGWHASGGGQRVELAFSRVSIIVGRIDFIETSRNPVEQLASLVLVSDVRLLGRVGFGEDNGKSSLEAFNVLVGLALVSPRLER